KACGSSADADRSGSPLALNCRSGPSAERSLRRSAPRGSQPFARARRRCRRPPQAVRRLRCPQSRPLRLRPISRSRDLAEKVCSRKEAKATNSVVNGDGKALTVRGPDSRFQAVLQPPECESRDLDLATIAAGGTPSVGSVT